MVDSAPQRNWDQPAAARCRRAEGEVPGGFSGALRPVQCVVIRR